MRSINVLSVLAVLCLLCASASLVSAQENEAAILVGRLNTGDKGLQSSQVVKTAFDGATMYQINYARRFVDGQVASLHWEFLVAGAPTTNVKGTNLLLPRNYSTLFLTPGVKLKLFPNGGFSPYGVFGIGYGRYTSSQDLSNGQPNTGDRRNHTYAINYGGGIDMSLLGPLGVRGEVRDFVTGTPRLNTSLLANKQHNIQVAIGLVFRW